jgi:hypothetical protein
MRTGLLVVVSGTVLALCGACSAPAADNGGASPQAVAWVGTVCGAMRSVQDAGGTQPSVDPEDPAAAVRGLDTYLGGVVTAVQGARAKLKDAGPSPVANSDADITRIENELGQVQTAFESARTTLGGINPADPAALATGLTAALTPVQSLNVAADPIGDLRKNPAFDTVARSVPSCSST